MKRLTCLLFMVMGLYNQCYANEIIVYYPQPVTISQTVTQTIYQPPMQQVWAPVDIYYQYRLVPQNQYWIMPQNTVMVQTIPEPRHRCRLFNY
jgi:hypothetical protein